jgi:hypothetical protein
MYLYVKKGKNLPEGLTDTPLPFFVPDELKKMRSEKNSESEPIQGNLNVQQAYTSSEILKMFKLNE